MGDTPPYIKHEKSVTKKKNKSSKSILNDFAKYRNTGQTSPWKMKLFNLATNTRDKTNANKTNFI